MKGKHFFTSFITAIIFSLAMLGTVQASQYVGVAHVSTDYQIDEPFNTLVTDESANGVSIFYGHSTSRPWLFWEVDYTDFGDTGSTWRYPGKYYDITEKYDYEAKSLSFWAVGKHDVFSILGKPLKITGRLGASIVDATGTGSYSVSYDEGPTYGVAASDSDTGVGLAYGVGLEYEVHTDVLATVDWRTRDVNLTLFNESVNFNADTWQVGLAYKF